MKSSQVISFISHWLNKVDEHSIHSPFFFDFYINVIKASQLAEGYEQAEKLRNTLLENQTVLKLEKLGAGSNVLDTKPTIAQIARISLTPQRFSALYDYICNYNDSKYIVELGTSMGINTLYLSQNSNRQVFTFEGSQSLINIALTHFELFEKENIKLIEGNIDKTLPQFLQGTAKINFVLMDANHRYEPTMRYFNLLVRRLNEKSIVVIDDIHWSEEMEKAWKELYKHELVYGSIDLYRCGILFFDPALNKQHFILSL